MYQTIFPPQDETVIPLPVRILNRNESLLNDIFLHVS